MLNYWHNFLLPKVINTFYTKWEFKTVAITGREDETDGWMDE